MVVAAPLAQAEGPAGEELHGLALEGAEQEVDVVGRPGLARARVGVLRRPGDEALAERAQCAHLGSVQEEAGSVRGARPCQPLRQRLPRKQGQEREVPPHAQKLAAPERTVEADVQSRLPIWAGQSDRACPIWAEPRRKTSVTIPASLDPSQTHSRYA